LAAQAAEEAKKRDSMVSNTAGSKTEMAETTTEDENE